MTLTPKQKQEVLKNLFEANACLSKCAFTLRKDKEYQTLLYHAGMTIKTLQDKIETTAP